VIYSVWNQGRRGYDYFEDGQSETSANVGKPDHIVNRTLGSTVQQAAWPLPTGAVPTGAGDYPVGRIAISSSRRGLGGDEGNVKIVKAGLLLMAAALLIKYVVPASRRKKR
jgi:hypothetical protein